MTEPLRLHPDDLERLAQLIAAEICVSSSMPVSTDLLDVSATAKLLGVSADFVREHAVELGGVRITGSPRAPWRFDAATARERLLHRSADTGTTDVVSARPKRRVPRSASKAGRVLTIRGQAP